MLNNQYISGFAERPGYYLYDNPPARSQYGRRTEPVRIIVLHTTQARPDFVGTDNNAEGTAKYISTRSTPGCYHTIVDRDSIVPMADPAIHQVWGARYGVNAYAAHVSMSTRAEDFLDNDGWQIGGHPRSEYFLACAEICARWCVQFGIPPVKLDRVTAMNGGRGITSHAIIDPTRRYDPGFDDEWEPFLEVVRDRIAQLQGADMTVNHKGKFVAYEFVRGGEFNEELWRFPAWKYFSEGAVEAKWGAEHHGDMSEHELVAPITTALSTASGEGYWLIAADGGVFGFGDAWYPRNHRAFYSQFHSSLVEEISQAVLVSEDSFRLVAKDGGIFEMYR